MGFESVDLRGEREVPPSQGSVDQGLDPEAVAGEQQVPGLPVPEREGEHADQPPERRDAFAAQERQQHFGVAGGAKPLAPRFQLGTQIPVVVNLAVVDDDEPTAVRDHGLGGGVAEVDDGEPGVGEPEAAPVILPQAGAVGAAMAQAIPHPGQDGRRGRGAAGYAAHAPRFRPKSSNRAWPEAVPRKRV